MKPFLFPFEVNPQGYRARLEQRRAELKALRELRESTPPPPTLTEQIKLWWQGLPPEEQSMAYDMDFFKRVFGESPARLGPVLFSLGFKRKRLWAKGKPHFRYWVKEK